MSEPINNTSGCCRLRSGREIRQPTNEQATVQDSDDETIFVDDDLLAPVNRESKFRLLSTYNDTMAEGTSSLLLNTPFNGRPDEDISEFLKTVGLWATLRKADEETRISALALLLRGNAADWFHTQPQVTESYRELKNALRERYGPQRRQCMEGHCQSLAVTTTDDFITVVKAGRRVDISDDQLLIIALNGLRPSIRQHVIQHPISNLDDLRQWGRATELSLQDARDDDASNPTARELAERKDKIRQLRIHSVQSSQPPMPSFVDDAHDINAFQRSSVQHNDTPNNQQQIRFRQQRQYQPSAQYQRSQQQHPSADRQNFTRCNNFGGKHSRNSSCPARNKPCFYCGKLGHFQSVCMAAKGNRYSK